MSQNKKLKNTIESTLKKIDELVEEFNDIWERVYSAETQAQKERFESDLKKLMKKLQRQRDILKGWTQNPDSTIAQYGDRLNSAKKTIEDKMQKFRECEKETKTKAFSKEGLRQPNKQTPEDEKREEVENEFCRQISELKKEIEECEVEEKREKNRKKNVNQDLLQRLGQYIHDHHKYISNIELILRQLNNHIINPYDVNDLIEGIDEYIKSYRDPDFWMDEELFDEFDLNPASEDSDGESDHSVESSLDSTSVSTSDKNSVVNAPVTIVKAPVAVPPPIPVQTTSSTTPTPSITPSPSPTPLTKPLPVNSVWKKPTIKPTSPAEPINYSEIIKRAVKPTSPTKQETSPVNETPVSSYLTSSPSFIDQRLGAPAWTRYETCDSLLYAVMLNAPTIESVFSDKAYIPKRPVATPCNFPPLPIPLYNRKPALGMPLDVAFFAFAMKQNEFSQYLAARTLQQNGWRFEKKSHKWYFKTSQAKKNEKGEECYDVSVFDYATWKSTEVHDVVLSELDFEEEILP